MVKMRKMVYLNIEFVVLKGLGWKQYGVRCNERRRWICYCKTQLVPIVWKIRLGKYGVTSYHSHWSIHPSTRRYLVRVFKKRD